MGKLERWMVSTGGRRRERSSKEHVGRLGVLEMRNRAWSDEIARPCSGLSSACVAVGYKSSLASRAK